LVLNPKILKKLFKAVAYTHDDELGCGDCCDEIEEFIELKLAGKSPEDAYPLVREHLDKCGDCREEYEALLTALKATA
jgi:bacterioferritin-associated ferredoxin